MKTKHWSLIGLILLLCQFQIFGQIAKNVKWSEIVTKESVSPVIHRYEILGDTVLSNVLYYKVTKDGVYYSAVRQDSQNKVYVFFPNKTHEKLVYDFQWNVGDSLKYEPLDNEQLLLMGKIDQIGSILLFNNKPYQTVAFGGNTKIIQGVGSLNGFFTHLFESINGEKTELLCYSKNNQLLYLNPKYTNCDGKTSYKSCFGKEYTKWTIIATYEYTDWGPIEINSQGYFTNLPSRYMKEDTILGKLSYHLQSIPESEDTEIMNLSVWVGDTIPLFDFYFVNFKSNDKYRAYALVDSIYFKDGRKHVRMNTQVLSYSSENNPEKFEYIEGMGTNRGVMPDMPYSYLLCYETERESYLNPHFKECKFGGMAVREHPVESRVKQTNHTLEVMLPLTATGAINIYNRIGIACKSVKFSDTSTISINTDNLASGIYILECKDDMNNYVVRQKLLIH
ncbi:MAG: hypothetical protein PHV20_05235 [Bacteroidales bacterium]|nr:hypothetical protein [Bacteroidales bacterium]